MHCPNCGAFCTPDTRFCGNCGAPLAPETPSAKDSDRVPILIMIFLSLLGIILFFVLPTPASSEIPWFDISGNTLCFDESAYTGTSELKIPEAVGSQTVLYLEQGCFADCDALTTVILPHGLKSISRCAFEDCDSLRGIFIPEGISTIGDSAFGKCGALEAVCIPASVTDISPGAFCDCPSLIHVFYGGTYAEWLALSNGYVAPDANIYCSDGNYCQGKPIP